MRWMTTLNTADGIAVLFDLAKDINTNLNTATNPHREIAEEALKLFDSLAECWACCMPRRAPRAAIWIRRSNR